LSSYCDQVASEKCAKNDDDCKIKVTQFIKVQETNFRLSTIQSCKCDTTDPKYKGLDSKTIAQSCSNDCITRACHVRSSLVCQSEADQLSCVRNTNDKCVTLHTSINWLCSKKKIKKNF